MSTPGVELEVVTMRCARCNGVARVKVDARWAEMGERRVGELVREHARQCSGAISVERGKRVELETGSEETPGSRGW